MIIFVINLSSVHWTCDPVLFPLSLFTHFFLTLSDFLQVPPAILHTSSSDWFALVLFTQFRESSSFIAWSLYHSIQRCVACWVKCIFASRCLLRLSPAPSPSLTVCLFPPLPVGPSGTSELALGEPVCECKWLSVSLVWPWNKRVTCPGWNPAFTQHPAAGIQAPATAMTAGANKFLHFISVYHLVFKQSYKYREWTTHFYFLATTLPQLHPFNRCTAALNICPLLCFGVFINSLHHLSLYWLLVVLNSLWIQFSTFRKVL